MWLVIMQSKINFLKFLSSHHICDVVDVDVRLEVLVSVGLGMWCHVVS